MKVKVDDVVAYWSEPRIKNGPPGGPYPARVVAVIANDKEDRVDLSVEVAEGIFKSKTSVPFAALATKHHWSATPKE